MNLKGINKTIAKGIGSALVNLAVLTGTFSGGSAANAYYSRSRGNYAHGNTYRAEKNLLKFTSNQKVLGNITPKIDRAIDAVSLREEDIVLMKHVEVKELILVDSDVQNSELFFKMAKPGVEVVQIPNSNGLNGLRNVIDQYEGLNVIHLMSHGKNGELMIGGEAINSESLNADIRFFASLNGALKMGGDLLFYGCELAKSDNGEEFLEIIQGNTHVDVAASNDNTGNEAFGGDWELEIQKGEIEAKPLADSIAMEDFTGILQSITFDMTAYGYGKTLTHEQNGETLVIKSTMNVMFMGDGYGYFYSQGNNYETEFQFYLQSGNAFDLDYVRVFKNSRASSGQSVFLESGGNSTGDYTVIGSYQNIGQAAGVNFDGITNFSIKSNASGNDFAIVVNSLKISNITAPSSNTAPSFTSSTSTSVDENTSTSTVILDVNANDGDGGGNDANVTYSITGTDAGDFELDPDDGELRFAEIPDFENAADDGGDNVYNITVTANDGEGSNNTAAQDITITVNDVELSTGITSFDGLESGNTELIGQADSSGVSNILSTGWNVSLVNNNVSDNTSIRSISDIGDDSDTIDDDVIQFLTGATGYTDYIRWASNEGTEFQLNSFKMAYGASGARSFTITGYRDGTSTGTFATEILNNDLNEYHTIDLSAKSEFRNIDEFRISSGGAFGNTRIDDINISEASTNSNPVITADQTFSIREDAANEASLGTVSATDVDEGTTLQNWDIVSGNDDGIFEINSSTGELTVVDNSNLDFETTTTYTLLLTVSDGTDTSSEETVAINVSDFSAAVTIADISESEDDTFTLTLTLDNAVSGGLSLDVTTSNNTATAGLDFTPLSSETVTFTGTAGETEQLTIYVTDDNTTEVDETFTVKMENLIPGSVDADDIDITDTATVTIINNDTPGFTITESDGGTTTSELGTTDSFTVVLDAQPVSDVVFNISSGDTGEGTLSASKLTFSNANWSTSQTVTVYGVDDGTLDGSQSYNVTVSVDEAESDDLFDDLANQTVSVTNTDDEEPDTTSPDITISGPIGTVNGSFTATFTFSEDVSGFSVSDISVGNGSVSNFNATSASIYTASITPLLDGTVTIDVESGAAADGSANSSNEATQYVVTNDRTAPTLDIVNSTPADDATEVAVSDMIILDFSEDVDGSSGNITLYDVTNNGAHSTFDVNSDDEGATNPKPGTIGFVGDKVYINPSPELSYETEYAIHIDAEAIEDGIGNSFAGISDNTTFNFITKVGPGFTVAESGGGTEISEGGGTDDFTVVLNTQPSSNVMLALSSGDTGEGTVSVADIIFTPVSWDTPQTVTMTGVDDDVIDGDQVFNVTLSVNDASSDDAFDEVGDQAVIVTTTDDDEAGFTVTESDGTTEVSEAGSTDSFSVVLDAEPVSNVVINISSGDTGETTADVASLTFNSSNWDIPQTVTMTGQDDSDLDGNQTTSITLSINDASSDDDFDALADQIVSVTTEDDDVIQVSVNDTTVTESSSSATMAFKVSLSSVAPSGGISVDYATSDSTATSGSDYTATSGTLNFAEGESTKNVEVTVSGDETVERDEILFLTLSNATGDAEITDAVGLGTITNDDEATVTMADVSIDEDDGTAELTLTLDNAVDGGFNVNLSTADMSATAGSDYTAITEQTVTFTGSAGETETVSITLDGDSVVEADELIKVSLSGLVPATVDVADIDIFDEATVTVKNDEKGTLTIANVNGNEDDGVITVTVTLDNAVDGGFSIDVSTADSSASVADSDYTPIFNQTLTFSGTAGEMESFTVTPTADGTPEGDEIVKILMSDLVTASVDAEDIVVSDSSIVTINDDDAVLFSVNDTLANEGNAGSTILRFNVSLNNSATNTVTVDYALSDGSAKTTDTDYTNTSGTLTFNAGESSKTVEVEIAGDEKVEADETFNLTLSNNTGLSAIADDEGVGTIVNDDQAVVTIANVVADEDDGTATITLIADKAVQGGFSLEVNTGNGSATAGLDYTPLSDKTVTFSGTEGETETVSITLSTDDIVEADETFSVSMENLSTSSLESDDIDISDEATVTITNDDEAGFIVTQSNDTTITSESGSTDTLSVVLNAEPANNVVLLASGSNTSEGTLGQNVLAFTSTNWDTPQEIVVTGVDDDLVDGDMSYNITLSVDAANSDDLFDSLADQQIAVTNTDDDIAGFTVTESDGSSKVSETGTTDSFTLVLDAQPQSDVTLTISSADVSEVTSETSSTTFTSANWDTPQTITLTGVDDNVVDGDQDVDITISVNPNNSDDVFDDVADETVTALVSDDEVAGFTLTETNDTTQVAEAGGTDTFNLVLDAGPLSDVTLDISSSDEGEAVVSPSQITFTPSNWNTSQEITVMGQDELVDDGDKNSTIMVLINKNSTEDAFDALADQSIDVATIDDDNTPVFTSLDSVEVDENSTKATTILATDADEGTTLEYSISGGVDASGFTIDQPTGVLTFSVEPDYENPADADTDNDYEIMIEVSDGTNSASKNLVITILNLEDNAPVFTSDAAASIMENETAILTATATDADAGSVISYSVSGGTDSPVFTINSSTGALTFITAPDFEDPEDADSDNIYEVEITATDGTNNTALAVEVTVTDENEFTPAITSNTSFFVYEEFETGALITQIIGEDGDSSAVLSYSISENVNPNGNATETFSIDSETGELTLADPADLDKEINAQLEIEITISDGSRSSSKEFIIQVLTAPVAEIFSPEDEAVAIKVDSVISVTFDQAISELDLSGITIQDDQSNEVTLTTVSLQDSTISIEHESFANNQQYTVTIPANSVQNNDEVGNAEISWSFTSILAQPVATTFNPIEEATGIVLNQTLEAQFDQPITESDFSGISVEDEGGTAIDITSVQIENPNTLVIEHEPFANFREYIITIPSGTVMNGDEVENSEVSWSFTSIRKEPEPLSFTPANEAGQQSVESEIAVKFDQPITLGEESAITLENEAGTVSGLTFSATDSTLQIIHDGLENESEYTVTIGDGAILNLDEVPNASFSWEFTTIIGLPNMVTLSTPVNETGSVVFSSTEFTWEEDVRSISYDIQVSADENFAEMIINESGISEASFSSDTLLDPAQAYYWRVRGVNEAGAGLWGEASVFVTKPSTPKIIFPASDASSISTAPQLEWNTVDNAVTTQLQFGESMLTEIVVDTTMSGEELQLNGLEANSSYSWKLRNLDTLQSIPTASEWTTINTFFTRPDPVEEETDPVTVNIDFGGTSGGKTGEPGAGNERTAPQQTDYRMVGLPGTDGIQVDDFFEGPYKDSWRAFIETGDDLNFYDEYEAGDERFVFKPGLGFWVLSTEIVTADRIFTSVQTDENDSYGFSVHPGWNIIANPYQSPVVWGLVEEFNNINAALYGYEKQFTEMDTLKPFKGYYYYNDPVWNQDTLFVPYTGFDQRGTEGPAPKDTTTLKQSTWISLDVEFADSSSSKVEMLFGGRQKLQSFQQPYPDLRWAKMGAVFTNDVESRLRYKRLLSTKTPDQEEYRMEVKAPTGSQSTWRVNANNLSESTAALIRNKATNQSFLITRDEPVKVRMTEPLSNYDLFVGDKYYLIELQESFLPADFELSQNYPNPFNPVTNIRYSVPERADVRLEIFDILGRKVQTLVNEQRTAGWHMASWDASGFASGMYLYRLQAGDKVFVKKLTLIK